ncbi:glycosyltransferase family 4 protein [Runella sp. SP2]|uniref:glycosyltransferase family 4 protein n=1 Tax=Runella sp. SP2 TaxID=2268026 RepID=UPI000F07965D|nr:glycosyltransferase family 4 protein [Runella sp. SP2]AYQ31230.1 glycosyltransferase [Runella sp. SP2]
MSKRKILVVSLGRKALEEHTKNMIAHLSGNEFDLICSKYSETDYKVPNIIFKTKTYQSSLTFIINTIFVLPLLLLKLTTLRKSYDIIYFPTVHPWNTLIILVWRALGNKTILTIHDAVLHPGEENFLLQLSLKYSMVFTSHLLFLTEYVRQTAYSRFNLKAPYKIIAQGLLPLPNIKTSRGIKGKNILFLGRISKYKGVELLIEAVNELPDNAYDSLTIAGMPIYKVILPEENPKIKLIEKYLAEEEMSDLLNGADIIVLPYLEASQSGVVLLAILAEKPIICTNVGGISEQLNSSECYFINPNKEELKKAISTLLSNSEMYISMQESLKNKQQGLLWEQKTQQLLEYVQDIRNANFV